MISETALKTLDGWTGLPESEQAYLVGYIKNPKKCKQIATPAVQEVSTSKKRKVEALIVD